MTTEARPLLTAEQVAKLLQLKPSTIYDAASRGRIPCVRLWKGSRRSVVRFVAEDIERIVRERSSMEPARGADVTRARVAHAT